MCRLSVLPISFHKLSKLKFLRVEGNIQLDDPPEEIIAKGGVAVVQYCKMQYNENEAWRMRLIVISMMDVLKQIEDR